MKPGLPVLLIAATMLGCQSIAYDQPARIIAADDASRAALQAAVNAKVGVDVTLADDALTDNSILTLQRNPPRTMDNQVPQGRIMEAPIQFQLVINGADCILVDHRDRSRQVLANTRCAAEQ